MPFPANLVISLTEVSHGNEVIYNPTSTCHFQNSSFLPCQDDTPVRLWNLMLSSVTENGMPNAHAPAMKWSSKPDKRVPRLLPLSSGRDTNCLLGQ